MGIWCFRQFFAVLSEFWNSNPTRFSLQVEKNGSFGTECHFPDPFLFVGLKQKNCMDA